jgi:hypothetical protein
MPEQISLFDSLQDGKQFPAGGGAALKMIGNFWVCRARPSGARPRRVERITTHAERAKINRFAIGKRFEQSLEYPTILN